MPITLLYHARTNGYVCDRIARASGGKIQSVPDRPLPSKINGTLIRWDSKAEVRANHTINTAEAVTASRNKRDSRVDLEGLCPTTWFTLNECVYPCVIRPKRHYAARKFFVCQNITEARQAIRTCRRWYASKLIQKTREYRVFVFQDHVVKVVRRFHNDPGQVAWNIAVGGGSKRLIRTSWPVPVLKAAILAGRRLALDWYAADVIVDAAGKSYVLELNTAPGLDRKETMEMLAKLFATENTIPANKLGNTWQSLIHPALR